MTQPFFPSDLWSTGSRTVGLQDQDGASFDDRYTLNAKLGDGMTAVVYAATDRRTGRPCACKLAERRLQRPHWSRLAQVLQHESALLQRLGEHPSIVRWQGLYRGSTQMALVLELVSGGDCQQLLQRHGCLAESAVHAMISQLRGAVEHLHSQQVLHRDVKLENLLVNNEVWPPQIKLCDFGHACAATHMGDDDTEFYGTPGYAAPEVQSGPIWSYAADVWAVGVVMYALLANALPFEREYSWLRPPDFSGRAWWQVSVEAKLLLQAVLESDPMARATLSAMGGSAWIAGSKLASQASAGSADAAKPRPTLGRRGYGSMMSLGAHGGQQSSRAAGRSSAGDEFFLDAMNAEEQEAERQLERQRLQKMRDALRDCRMQGLRGSLNAADAIRNREA